MSEKEEQKPVRTVAVTIRLSEEEKRGVEKLAIKHDRPVASMVRKLIQQGIKEELEKTLGHVVPAAAAARRKKYA